MRALQNGHNPWAANPKLLEEMPDLKHTVATAASGEASTPGADGPAVTGPGMATLNEMEEEAKKLAMLLWALKVHRECLVGYGAGSLSSVRLSRTGPSQSQGHSRPRRSTAAVERRTHPSSFGADMVEPFHTDQVEAHCQEGTRPPLGSILSFEVPHPHLLAQLHLQVHLQLVVQPPSGH